MQFESYVTRTTLSVCATIAMLVIASAPVVARDAASVGRPLAPNYQVHDDGSVSLRICFNWSCASRQRVTFQAHEMAGVASQMALCPQDSAHNRLQRLRIGIWQMEALAEHHQPKLGNDEAVNARDEFADGRMDCIDNSSNTTTYLKVLSDLDLLPGWSVAEPEVRDLLSLNVHWTAVAVDAGSGDSWAVDSWFRGNGHLPFVMPLSAWEDGDIAWQPPLAAHNPYPRYSEEICALPASDAGSISAKVRR